MSCCVDLAVWVLWWEEPGWHPCWGDSIWIRCYVHDQPGSSNYSRQLSWRRELHGDILHWCLRVNEWPGELMLSFLANVHVRYMLSCVRLSVVCLFACLYRSCTLYSGEILLNFSMPFGTMPICWHLSKILGRSSQGNPSVGRVKHKRGSGI